MHKFIFTALLLFSFSVHAGLPDLNPDNIDDIINALNTGAPYITEGQKLSFKTAYKNISEIEFGKYESYALEKIMSLDDGDGYELILTNHISGEEAVKIMFSVTLFKEKKGD